MSHQIPGRQGEVLFLLGALSHTAFGCMFLLVDRRSQGLVMVGHALDRTEFSQTVGKEVKVYIS